MDWYGKDTKLSRVISDPSSEAKVSMVADAALDPLRPVTLTCENCNLEDVLNKLCQTLGCTWKKTPYFYWIMPTLASKSCHFIFIAINYHY